MLFICFQHSHCHHLYRPPFSKSDVDFKIVRREVLQLALDITQAVQKQTDLQAATNTILGSVSKLMTIGYSRVGM